MTLCVELTLKKENTSRRKCDTSILCFLEQPARKPEATYGGITILSILVLYHGSGFQPTLRLKTFKRLFATIVPET